MEDPEKEVGIGQGQGRAPVRVEVVRHQGGVPVQGRRGHGDGRVQGRHIQVVHVAHVHIQQVYTLCDTAGERNVHASATGSAQVRCRRGMRSLN